MMQKYVVEYSYFNKEGFVENAIFVTDPLSEFAFARFCESFMKPETMVVLRKIYAFKTEQVFL